MKRAFSLIEILVVMAIIAILTSLSVPQFFQMQKRAKLNQSVEKLFDQLRLARLEAASLNRTVAVLLIDPERHSGGKKIYTQVQRFYEEDLKTGQTEAKYIPSAKRVNLAEGIVIHPDAKWSSLVVQRESEDEKFAGVRSGFRSLQIYPSGKTSLEDYDSNGAAKDYFVTLTYQEEIAKPTPSSFITITVDPKTALPKIWRR